MTHRSFKNRAADSERGVILEAFASSPEFRALESGRLPAYAEHFLRKTWHWSMPPQGIYADLVLDFIYDAFARYSSVSPGEAASIMAELRAYFGFAARALQHDNAERCAAQLVDPEVSGILALSIQRERRRQHQRQLRIRSAVRR